MADTLLADIPTLVSALHAHHATRFTTTAAFRLGQLRALHALLTDNEDEILDALHSDLKRSKADSYLYELGPVKSAVAHAARHFEEVLAPLGVEKSSLFLGETVETRRVPWGVVLCISPWYAALPN